MELTRRRMLLGSLAAGGLLLAGCGSGGNENQAPGTGGGDGGGEGFPVTVDHKLGTTTIERAPQRLASLGYTDHDAIMALGVAPVGVRYWYGDKNNAIQPWAKAAAQAVNAKPTVLDMDTIAPEKVAALNPDEIIGVYSDLDAKNYPVINQIAPTVGPVKDFGDYEAPWQETTRLIGRALGKAQEADKLVSDVEARFAQVAADNPQWKGKTVAVAYRSADKYGVFASGDPRARFFTALGFVVPKQYDDLAGDKFYADVSFEQASQLDQELIVWDQLSFTPGGKATLQKDPLASKLKAMQQKHALYLEGATELAFAWQTVLSLPSVLDGVVPQLQKMFPKA
ncbi:ABC transporter substrate-binding protein [Pseudonocardia phyllosphaerae]|uniref:ABC transporter substrate-binding protein n=1 Tax=Pseudonocardia phyllosphaerae TaxID=3390502 RepID=UPI00397D79D0